MCLLSYVTYIIYIRTSISLSFPSAHALQKDSQLSLDNHLALMDIVLLWMWLQPKIQEAVDGEMMATLHDMFTRGSFDTNESRNVGLWFKTA